jgi:glycosyltransferase involved in cell wall biosynthesis
MKLLFVIESLNIGGAERVLLDSVKELRKTHDITVLAVSEYPDLPSYVDAIKELVNFKRVLRYFYKGPWVRRLYSRCVSWLKRVVLFHVSPRMAYRACVRDDYDVEIAFLEGSAARILSGSTNQRSAKYAWIHTDMLVNPWSESRYRNVEEERACYRRFDRVFAVSRDVADVFYQKFQLPATFIQNIIDDERVRDLSRATGDPYSPGRPMVLVAIGRMVEVKGYDRLLAVASRLKQKSFDFQLHFIGGGEDEENLKRLAASLSLDNVVFHGYQDNPYPYLVNADLYVCSSYAEGFSSTVAESLILETPVITTDCAGMRDLLGESEWGMIVENSTEGLFEGLTALLEDRALLDTYAQRARERGREFSSKRLAEALQGYILADTARVNVAQADAAQTGAAQADAARTDTGAKGGDSHAA